MKEIRLLTFHDSHNYGAVLQCYALWTELSQYGNCKVIDYHRTGKDYRLIRRYTGWYNRIKAIFRYSVLKRRFDLMEQFIDRYRMESQCDGLELNDFDLRDKVCIVGSDQVWNCGKNYDASFFFKGVISAGKIAYAASMGKSEIPAAILPEVDTLLKQFDFISVREKTAAALLKEKCGVQAKVVLDPVFLKKQSFWDKLTVKYKAPDKYILVYLLDVQPIAKNVIRELKEKTGLKVVAITTIVHGKTYGADIDAVDVGPGEFLWLIKNASFVVTSSFHGTAFSVIFQRDFYTIPKKSTAERMLDLMESLALQERIVNNETIINADHIDYNKVQHLLNKNICESKEFLRSSICKVE